MADPLHAVCWHPAACYISAFQIWKDRPRLLLRVSFQNRTMGNPSLNSISASQHFSFQLLLPVVLCFVFLYLAVAAGGGRLSVDAMWRG